MALRLNGFCGGGSRIIKPEGCFGWQTLQRFLTTAPPVGVTPHRLAKAGYPASTLPSKLNLDRE
jgi:hypothetical protein